MGGGSSPCPFPALGDRKRNLGRNRARACTHVPVYVCKCLARAQSVRLNNEAPSSLPLTGQVCTRECVPVLLLISHVTSLGLNAFVHKKRRTLSLPTPWFTVRSTGNSVLSGLCHHTGKVTGASIDLVGMDTWSPSSRKPRRPAEGQDNQGLTFPLTERRVLESLRSVLKHCVRPVSLLAMLPPAGEKLGR